MLFEELMKEEYNAGKADAMAKALGDASAVLMDTNHVKSTIIQNLKFKQGNLCFEN